MAEPKETCIEYLDVDKYATFCSAEKKWINKIIKLQQAHPDEVDILYMPEDNNGVILAHIPKKWMKVSPPKKSNLSDEQKTMLAERLRIARESKSDCV